MTIEKAAFARSSTGQGPKRPGTHGVHRAYRLCMWHPVWDLEGIFLKAGPLHKTELLSSTSRGSVIRQITTLT